MILLRSLRPSWDAENALRSINARQEEEKEISSRRFPRKNQARQTFDY